MSLVEFTIVMVIVAVLATVGIVAFQPGQANVAFHADQLRNDIRHTQTLAMAWQQPLQLVPLATGYQVECVTKSQPGTPCAAAVGPVTDPATEKSLVIDFTGSGVSWSGGTPAGLSVDKLGRPLNLAGSAVETSSNRVFSLLGDTQVSTVTMVHTTGFVTVP